MSNRWLIDVSQYFLPLISHWWVIDALIHHWYHPMATNEIIIYMYYNEGPQFLVFTWPHQIPGFKIGRPTKCLPSFKERLPKNMSFHNFSARCRTSFWTLRTVSISKFSLCVTNCAVPENIHTPPPPTDVFFYFNPPTPPRNFRSRGFMMTPTALEFPGF